MSFENNFKRVLESKNKKQTELLVDVLKKCGEKDPYDKYLSEKSNFNNMIKGKRQFKPEYIIYIEEILGIRFSDLYKDDYSIARYYENKGIRYAATVDKIINYKELLDEGENVFLNSDEYGKTIIDYICEYNSKNGLMYLIDILKMKFKNNSLTVLINGKEKSIYCKEMLKIVNMICLNEEVSYFNKLFAPDYNLGYRYLYGPVYDSDEFYKYILSSDKIINELFKLHDVSFHVLNPNSKIEKNGRYDVYHPILFKLIEYALKNSKKYSEQLKMMLKKGEKTNEDIISDLRKNHNYRYHIDEYEIKNAYDTYGYILYIDLGKYDQIDDELKSMIEKLNQGAKKVENKPSSSDIEFDKHLTPNEFYELIYKNSGLDNYLSDYCFIFMSIQKIVGEVNCKIDKIGDGLLEYLIEKKKAFSIDPSKEYEFRTITFAISFAELYKERLNNL